MIETGEIITLSNNKEYICFSSLDYEGNQRLPVKTLLPHPVRQHL